MLNTEICKKCASEYGYIGEEFSITESNGMVHVKTKKMVGSNQMEEGSFGFFCIFEDCKYKLEHTVMEQETIECF